MIAEAPDISETALRVAMTTAFQPLQKAMIVIAVSEYMGAYPDLPGTLNSADRIAAWARTPGDGRGYDVLEINDRQNTPVTAAQLSAEIDAFLTSRIIDRLVVYFAGHGLVRSETEQFWLLTYAANDLREGVDLYGFVDGLRRYNIGGNNPSLTRGQLSIIVDACRNSSAKAAVFKGDPILTTANKRNPIEIDYLMATTIGAYAFQPNAVSDGAPYCLFSDTLSEALEGQVLSIVEHNHHPFAPALLNQDLANYLDSEVQKRAAKFNENMVPDTVTGIRRDHNYYDLIRKPVGAAPVARDPQQPAGATRVVGAEPRRLARPKLSDYFKTILSVDRRITSSPEDGEASEEEVQSTLQYAEALVDDLQGSPYLAMANVSVSSAAIIEAPERVAVPPGGAGWFAKGEEYVSDSDRPGSVDSILGGLADLNSLYPKIWHYLPAQSFSLPAFVYRKSVGWVITPVLPSTVAVLLERDPAEVLLKGQGDLEFDLSLGTRLGASQSTARGLKERLKEADLLRVDKYLRPNAANRAGFAYELAGDTDNVLRTAHFMLSNDYLGFDLALLADAELTVERAETGFQISARLSAVPEAADNDRPVLTQTAFPASDAQPVRGGFPLFRRGWARLAERADDLPEPYARLATMIEPHSATVFRDDAAEILTTDFGYSIKTFPGN